MKNIINSKTTTIVLIIVIIGLLFYNNKNNYMNDDKKQDPLNTHIYTLDNGLKVYLSVFKEAPRVQTNIAIRAGSKHDPENATGLAHYLEHMLFKGTDKYGTIDFAKEKLLLDKIELLYETYRSTDMNDISSREKIWNQIDSLSGEAAKFAIANEYDKMLSGIGAKGTNAYTSNEKTVYINDIPSNQIQKWLKIESERFRNPVFRLFHTELETVYEEKNISLDSDGRKLFQSLLEGLFPNHQYGQQSTIGTVPHLKNPSIKEIGKYYNKYYVPNNMAICLSGDFDVKQVMRWIEKYFGAFEARELSEFDVRQEEPITSPIVREVYGPEAEMLYMGFRFNGASSEDIPKLRMLDMILSNNTAGLIDLNLNQKQELINGGCFPMIMQDYSFHGFYASPKQGQELEAVKDLLLQQIEKVKSGDFPDWLITAIISDLKLDKIKKYETNSGRANEFVSAFTLGLDWDYYQNQIKNLESITKEEIIEFAKTHYKNNYVVVYKKKKEDLSAIKVTKPKITPVSVNRDVQSEFLKNLLEEDVKIIKPVFIDFNKDIKISMINDVPVIYKENSENERFQLKYTLDIGSDNNPKFKIAFDYFKYLGTDKISSLKKQQEFYKLGSKLDVNCGSDKIEIILSGLNTHFAASVELLEDLLNGAVKDDMALENLKQDILKKRKDAKLDKQKILFSGMLNYGKYGKSSSFTNNLTEEELQKTTSDELIDIIHNITHFHHKIFYYGPEDINSLNKKLLNLHKNSSSLKDLPVAVNFKEKDIDKNQVFIVDYDMKQAEVVVMSKGERLNIEKIPIIRFHNEYFGGGMSSIIFQELRESKALAYSVYSTYTIPRKKNQSHYQFSYIGTQADKLKEAMGGLMGLLDKMPESEGNMNAARDGVIEKIRTERITKTNILNEYEKAKKIGIDYDIRKKIFNSIEKFTMQDLSNFHDNHISNDHYVYMVLGDKDLLDIDVLEQYGQITYLSLEDIFGY